VKIVNCKFNINCPVKVKLTHVGVEILKNKRESLNKFITSRGGNGLGELEIKLDENGYYTTQMWCLMNDFGENMRLGEELPFEAEAILCEGEIV
jgi:hypothetical protein